MIRSLLAVPVWALMLVWGCGAPAEYEGALPDFEVAWNAPSTDSQVIAFDPPARPRDEGVITPAGDLWASGLGRLSIGSIRPARSGWSTVMLTVLLRLL
jgi:hypothetical protein